MIAYYAIATAITAIAVLFLFLNMKIEKPIIIIWCLLCS